MIINIEIQKDQPADYHLLNRSIYYVSRMISSQKGRDFVKSKYNDLKRVFNIWICLDMNENSLSRYYLANENILGECHWKGKQDLINIIFIGLTKDLPERDKKYELHRLLNALLSDKIKVQEKIEVIENEYHILMNDDLRRDVNIMCNLGEGIEERAIKETTERVTKKVTEEVTREVTEEMTEQFIRSMYDKGCSIELIADVARKSIAEVKAILDKAILSV
ncbi:PD-(D/E)XK nuclease family transposase [Coprococcus sp. CLA-AA-H190]|uniref:PD-(D/E)XK nuclease family transposase n=2 Tax=Lachnospiraceae TaxID=186803 RepID=A0ABV1B2B3_9FIRM